MAVRHDAVKLCCGGPCRNCPEARFVDGAVRLSEHGQSVTVTRDQLAVLIAEAARRGLVPSREDGPR